MWIRLLYVALVILSVGLPDLFVKRKGSAAETKPFTNFSVFHDNLITRLKAVSQIQLDLDKQVKETETRFLDKLAYVCANVNL